MTHQRLLVISYVALVMSIFRESMKKYVQDRKEHTLSQMFEVNDNLVDRVLQRKLQKDLGQLYNLKQQLA